MCILYERWGTLPFRVPSHPLTAVVGVDMGLAYDYA